MLSKSRLNQLYSKDTQFANLMTGQIFSVLLMANPYDAFTLEDGGHIDEKIFDEYTSLSLRYPPRFSQVSTEEEALRQLGSVSFDLMIYMPDTGDNGSFDIGRHIKEKYEQMPIVILTPFSRGITRRIANEDLSAFDYVFCWLGNTDLLVSIIRLIESKVNLEHDVKEVGMQLTLLVGDSIRFYSSVFPNSYKFVLRQSQEFSTETSDAHQRAFRMHGRPKIVLTHIHEETMDIYDRYTNNILGVITDAHFSYVERGEKDGMTGIKLCVEVKKKDPSVPLIIRSSETENTAYAAEYGATLIDKDSKKMDVDPCRIVPDNFGFGDFVFRNLETSVEIARVRNLRELQNILFAVPAELFLYRISRSHVSRWLYSRAIFPVAEFLRPITQHSLQDVNAHRKIIFEAIAKYRRMKNQEVIAVFERDRFDRYSDLARIGDGSLGGKGRGLTFIDNMVKRYPGFEEFGNIRVAIPKTVVLCTDVFDESMDNNNLYQTALSDADDDMVLRYFLKTKLPSRLAEDFFTLFGVVKSPIAVRSSSLLENSRYQPFTGIYNTYVVPYLGDKCKMLRMLSGVIKGVYASVYSRGSKTYMQATSNVIDQEKMAVILQRVVSNQYGDRYYPSMSGVAQSLDYYPTGGERAEEGTINLALGLGKYIAGGGMTLRFSPAHPSKVLQTSELNIALKGMQTRFYALDLENAGDNFSIDDGFNLLKLHMKKAEKDGSLHYTASAYDPYDQVIRDDLYPGGRKMITFVNTLQHDVFPLARILHWVSRHGQQEVRRPVEIEFTVMLNHGRGKTGTFYLFQVRPIVGSKDMLDEDLTTIPGENVSLRSSDSLGRGIMNGVHDIVYVKTDHYSASNNQNTAWKIEKLNQQFLSEGKSYVLVGPGRWESSDTWLGIPMKWPYISAARVIVKAGLTNYRVDPSQGTHFFQNLTSFGMGYFTINAFMNDGVYSQEFLNTQSTIFETEHLRHIRFEGPIVVRMDDKKRFGVVLMPDK